MYTGKTVFSQIINHAPRRHFHGLVEKYKGNFRAHKFSCWDQFLCMSFAQLTYRNGLRDIEACLKAQPRKLYHMGIHGNPSKNNIANANLNRNWRIYAEFAHILIAQARELYQDEDPFSIVLDNTVYALDSTTIDLCLSLFPWAKFRKAKGAVKLHTLLDMKGAIPSCIEITDGSVHDVNILDDLTLEPESYYVMDRGYIDFNRLYRIHKNLSFFVIRAKRNFDYRRLYSTAIDKASAIWSDQTIKVNGINTKKDYPESLRRIRCYDRINDKYLVFLTNSFKLPAAVIAELYQNRWKIELFFKWIKQHLRIQKFFGNSLNAVKTQIWIAISIYVLVAIIKKKYQIQLSLYIILQVLSVSLFEKVPLAELLSDEQPSRKFTAGNDQIDMFDFLGH
jgi:IS4 transposase